MATRLLDLFQPVRTPRVFEDVAAQVVDSVRAGYLRVGDQLPPERVMAEHLEVSRQTLREALKLLAHAGVLEIKAGPRGGAVVAAEMVPRSLIDAEVQLRAGEVLDLLVARRLIEPRVAQLAAVHATEQDFADLTATIEQQRRFVDDRDRFMDAGARFHVLLARATQNSEVFRIMRSMLKRLEVARDAYFRTSMDPDWGIAIHEKTLRAVMSRDPDQIAAVMTEHLGFLEDAWEAESGRAALRRVPDFLASEQDSDERHR